MLDGKGCSRRRFSEPTDSSDRDAFAAFESPGDLSVHVGSNKLLTIGSWNRVARGLFVMYPFELGNKASELLDRPIVEQKLVD
ncbi:MAG: hypothetical protein I4N50_12885, partial [Rhizobium sp.]|nr:hypothetical protein [Rhizobium sp.]